MKIVNKILKLATQLESHLNCDGSDSELEFGDESEKVKDKVSFISDKYPTYRDIFAKSPYTWLDGRQIDDGAEGLWRINDKLYDLTSFIETHPGGPDWLKLTKGTDITEAFEIHHITPIAEGYLPKFYVRDAKEPRHFKTTFKSNGFYKTLKRRVQKQLRILDRNPAKKSKYITDTLLALTFGGATLSAYTKSYLLAILSGLSLSWAVISSHNYIHMRDNWRMYIFNLSLMSYREWRITHVLSHHLYTNSLHDLEISLYEPFLVWLPEPKSKNLLQRYGSWFYGPAIYVVSFGAQFLMRVITTLFTSKKVFYKSDALAFLVPLSMYFGGNRKFTHVMKLWFTMIISGSFIFSFIAINSSHHHPTMAHDGDALKENLDWGIFQLHTVMDRYDIKGSLFFVLTHFGDHILHHLFPTIDHALLPQLDKILVDTCMQFEAEMSTCSWFSHIVGQHKQLARVAARTDIRG